LEASVEISSSALERLIALHNGDPARECLRLFVAGRRCCSYRYGLSFDAIAEDDVVVEVSSLKVAMDPASRQYCDGAQIDFVDSPSGAGFRVRGPILDDACACGGRG
jgi:iron-sulfur cluster assembly accessory protein